LLAHQARKEADCSILTGVNEEGRRNTKRRKKIKVQLWFLRIGGKNGGDLHLFVVKRKKEKTLQDHLKKKKKNLEFYREKP